MHNDILLEVYYFLSGKTTKELTPLKRMSVICSCSIESRSYKAEVNHMPFSPLL